MFQVALASCPEHLAHELAIMVEALMNNVG